MTFQKIIGAAAVALVLIFIVQNMATVEVQFFFWSLSLPRSLILLAVMAVGFLIGWLYHAHKVHQKDQDGFTR